MFVVLSDLHLTDSPGGNPHLQRDLLDFLRQIRARAEDLPECQEVELVLLGDIFDILHSRQWAGTALRPWQPHTRELGEVVRKILAVILDSYKEFLSELRSKGEKPLRVQYVIGNHDWLLNAACCRQARALLRERLEVSGTPGARLPEELPRKEYRVLALHGHQFDPVNHVQDDLWPWGDAVVIELLGGFLQAAGRELKSTAGDAFLNQVEQIYYVRPETLAPLWTLALLEESGASRAQRRAVSEAWKDAIKALLGIEYYSKNVKRYDKIPGFEDHRSALEWAGRLGPLRIADRRSVTKKLLSVREQVSYERRAVLRLDQARWAKFIVIGHTHRPACVPLETVRGELRVYLNTGTWRQVHEPGALSPDFRDFSTQFVTAHAVFYNAAEREATGKEYELHETTSSWGAERIRA
jgi:UDP-2,3-diacylglucosamine pyrophosphatase LpxH